MSKRWKKFLLEPIWKNNQVLIAVLGICSALAITIQLQLAITMTIAVIFVTSLSSLFISLLRNITPTNVRMVAELVIISTFVIIVDQFLQAFSYELSKTLSVFVGLIITNCIVMGRAESVAIHTPPLYSFLDGLGAAIGYGLVLILVASIREFFGFGSLFGIKIIPALWYAREGHYNLYVNSNLMTLAPSAFFILGFTVWGFNQLNGEAK